MELNSKKLLRGTLFSVIILVMLLLDLYYYYPAALPVQLSGHNLEAKESFAHVIFEPNKSSIINIGITVFDGSPPFQFVANWSDNFSQQNSFGVFSRLIEPGETLPQSVLVSVTDANNQKLDIEIDLQNLSSTTTIGNSSLTSSTAVVQINPSDGVIEFIEKGLPESNQWSLSIDGQNLLSGTNQIDFVGPLGNYSYSVSYDLKNISYPYAISPGNGTVDLDGQIELVNINFTHISTEELLSIWGKPVYRITEGMLSANVTYRSQIPTSTNIVVLSVLYNSAGKVISTTSSAGSVTQGNLTTFEILFSLPAAGEYTLDVSALTPSGIQVSNLTAISISD